MEMLDCGDHSCNFAQDKSGQRTNGGCRCLKAIPEELRSRINYTFHRLKSDHEALKMSVDSVCKHGDKLRADLQRMTALAEKRQDELDKTLLQKRELAEALGDLLARYEGLNIGNEKELSLCYAPRARAALQKAMPICDHAPLAHGVNGCPLKRKCPRCGRDADRSDTPCNECYEESFEGTQS